MQKKTPALDKSTGVLIKLAMPAKQAALFQLTTLSAPVFSHQGTRCGDRSILNASNGNHLRTVGTVTA
jgi:hypothetical protein